MLALFEDKRTPVPGTMSRRPTHLRLVYAPFVLPEQRLHAGGGVARRHVSPEITHPLRSVRGIVTNVVEPFAAIW
jgi:hypothetical protein